MIFFACIACAAWWNGALGCLLALAVLSQFLFAWQDFSYDKRIPLGEDDRQTIYLVAINYGLDKDSIVLRKTASGYFAD